MIVALLLGVGAGIGVVYWRRRGLWVGAIAAVGLAVAAGYVLWQVTDETVPWLGVGSTFFVVTILVTERAWRPRHRRTAV